MRPASRESRRELGRLGRVLLRAGIGKRRQDTLGRTGCAGAAPFVVLIEHADVARDLTATLEFELRIANRAGELAGAAHAQALAHGEIALIGAADVGLLDLAAAGEPTAPGDLERQGVVQGDLDLALDHEATAGADLPRQPDALADDQALAVTVRLGLGGHRCGRRLGAGARRARLRTARPGRQLDPAPQPFRRRRALGGLAGGPAERAL